MRKNCKRVKRELKNKGSIIDYYQDTMEFSNGNHETWDFVDHKGAAAMVAVTDDKKLVMVRQYRNALEQEMLEIPAGGKNPDESMQQAAVRELLEETGYQAKNSKYLLSIRTTIAFCNERIDIYKADHLSMQHQHLDENECVTVEEYSLDELLLMIREGKITDSKTICAILYYSQFEK